MEQGGNRLLDSPAAQRLLEASVTTAKLRAIRANQVEPGFVEQVDVLIFQTRVPHAMAGVCA